MLLFHNLFCKIVLFVKRVNHFDRKKKNTFYKLYKFFGTSALVNNNLFGKLVSLLGFPRKFDKH